MDLLIGTHRLLQKDVQFKDLGLLVVDEEQRFGVTHKERLKEIVRAGGRADPVRHPHPPDAEHGPLAASGTCPPWRSPPPTASRCRPMCWSTTGAVLADAMRRELERGGQVYYLHNRVETIDRTAARIQAMLGEDAAVAVAHGKMSQEEPSTT